MWIKTLEDAFEEWIKPEMISSIRVVGVTSTKKSVGTTYRVSAYASGLGKAVDIYSCRTKEEALLYAKKVMGGK
jgi:hypothetical protein